MPEDFADRAAQPIRTLAAHYGVCYKTVVNWRKSVGVSVPAGAPKGNQNHIGQQATRRKRGADDVETIKICLNCTAKRCIGHCEKVH